ALKPLGRAHPARRDVEDAPGPADLGGAAVAPGDMNPGTREVLTDARRWLEQERLWDEEVYVSPPTNNSPSKAIALQVLYDRYKDCTRCPLGSTRIQFVFGVG